jgi:hypothetical protein
MRTEPIEMSFIILPVSRITSVFTKEMGNGAREVLKKESRLNIVLWVCLLLSRL